MGIIQQLFGERHIPIELGGLQCIYSFVKLFFVVFQIRVVLFGGISALFVDVGDTLKKTLAGVLVRKDFRGVDGWMTDEAAPVCCLEAILWRFALQASSARKGDLS